MKREKKYTKELVLTVVALTLASWSWLCKAADIAYTFNSDVQGWYVNGTGFTVEWDSSHGRDGGGCLKITIPVDGTEANPTVDIEFDTSGYFGVELDLMVDPSSGTDGNGLYGNLQIVARDASWSWDSMWVGSIGNTYNSYRRVKRAFTSAYGPKAHLQLQIQSSSGTYNGDVIIYIDNVVIRDGTPPNEAVMFDFARPEDVTTGVSSWAGGSPVPADGITVSHDTSPSPLHPDGSLKFTVEYNSNNGGWQEGVVQFSPFDWDPSKFMWLECDLYLDAPAGQPTYGIFQVFQITSGWGWQWIGQANLSAGNIGTWTRYRFPVNPMSLSHGIVFQVGGSQTVPMTYYIDNVVVWKPAAPPTITGLVKEECPGRGVRIIMDQDGQQWQREAICSPAGVGQCFWSGYATVDTPVIYSFTITNFPDPVKHPGFAAHIFIVNKDTIPSAPDWNETYGGCDWNAADVAIMRVENGTNGGVNFSFTWKTNRPSANPPDENRTMVENAAPNALGTWSLVFISDTEGQLVGPSGNVLTNFTLPADAVANNFNPTASFLQFGMFKNDTQNSGVNNRVSGTFSRITKVNGDFTFDDDFSGPGLTANYEWRTTSSTAVRWVPDGIAWWLSWTLPASGFSVQSAPAVTGPWGDAGVTYTYKIGATEYGAVPAASLPSGPNAFFRLLKQ